MSYHLDLRHRVINCVLNGNRRRSASEIFDVHYNTVKTWVTKFKETGECLPQVRATSARRKLALEALRQDVQSAPESFQSERASRFGVVQSTISNALAKMGLTRKKPPPTIWNKMRNKSRFSSTPGRV